MTSPKTPSVLVLVVSDVGRSPRMAYHARSLAASTSPTMHLALLGLAGSEPPILPNVTLYTVADNLLPRPKSRLLYLVYAPAKALVQLLQLVARLLLLAPAPDLVLLQTPPAIPTLAAAYLLRALTGAIVLVDWHNLGFSMLQHRGLGARHPLVALSRAYERRLGRALDGHICVTRAMSAWLAQEWGIDARVLHDRPPAEFRRLDLDERHALFRRLRADFCRPDGTALFDEATWSNGATPWTTIDASTGAAAPRAHAPRLVVSSTSWGADEDFHMLLDALVALETALPADDARAEPLVVVAITGRGPLRDSFEARAAALRLSRVAVATMWLAREDYPCLLGSADLGVSMHTSTSGLDLPMKVLDMFGSGLPVCAHNFACLDELIVQGSNGLVFDSADQLAEQLEAHLAPTAAAARSLAALREGLLASEEFKPRWQQEWSRVVAPLVREALHKRRARAEEASTSWRRILLVSALVLLVGSLCVQPARVGLELLGR